MKRYLSSLTIAASVVFAQDGAGVYKARCAGCHDAPAGRVPSFSALRAMNPALILRAIEGGIMKTQAEGLSSAERYALLGYVSTPDAPKAPPPPPAAFCGGKAQPFANPSKGPQWSQWGVDLANTRFQNAEAAGITAAAVPKLKLKWAFGLGDGIIARSQPGVAGGRVFVGTQTGAVYSLDATTGCIHWTFDADGPVRTAVVIGGAATAFFGDQGARVYAVDAATGKLLWKNHVEEHFAAVITGAPLVTGGIAYVPVASIEEALPGLPSYECCTFRGSVVALDAGTGKRLWKTYTIAELPQPTKKSKTGAQMHGPSGAAVWSTPTFDPKSNALYVATGDNYSDPPTASSDAVLALDAKTGKILWSKQVTSNDSFNNGCDIPGKPNCPDSDGPDSDFGQPPMLVSLSNGRRALVIGQKSGVAHALDPDNQGEFLWHTRIGKGGRLGGIQWGSATDGERMYAAVSDVQIKVLMDPKSPMGYALDLDPNHGGGLFALRLDTGEKVWSSKTFPCGERKHCSPAQSSAVTAIPGVVFSGALDGHLRAYSASTGEVLWDVDTVRDYETINGQKARGGSLDASGPVIAGGMVYVNSGYGQFGGMPGNVLLAFCVGQDPTCP